MKKIKSPLVTCFLLAMALFSFKSQVQAQSYGTNYVIFEGEETNSELGLWKIVTHTDSTYFFHKDSLNAINNAYIEFTGNDHNGGIPTSPLQYKFICPKTGTYRIAMRMYQRLLGLKQDKCNDVWIRMEGDFTSASKGYTTENLKDEMKFYGRGTDTWGVCHMGDEHHKKEPVLYNLKKGEEYIFTMSGRAQRTCIDYLIFYETSIPLHVESFDDLAANNKKYLPKQHTIQTINAVDFDKYTEVDGYINAIKDKKNNLDILSVKKPLETAVAQLSYQGKKAKAIFKINTLLEKDGEPVYTLKINGKVVGSVVNNRIYGTGVKDYTIQNHVFSGMPVQIKKGDLIEVEFTNATNGLIPEGKSTATARARWESLEICL